MYVHVLTPGPDGAFECVSEGESLSRRAAVEATFHGCPVVPIGNPIGATRFLVKLDDLPEWCDAPVMEVRTVERPTDPRSVKDDYRGEAPDAPKGRKLLPGRASQTKRSRVKRPHGRPNLPENVVLPKDWRDTAADRKRAQLDLYAAGLCPLPAGIAATARKDAVARASVHGYGPDAYDVRTSEYGRAAFKLALQEARDDAPPTGGVPGVNPDDVAPHPLRAR